MIQLYDKRNLDALNSLELDEENAFIRSYFLTLISSPSEQFVANVHAEVQLLYIDGILMPITIGGHAGDSYVVSLISHYVHYAEEELHLITSHIVHTLAKGALRLIQHLFRWSDVTRTVFVNNWMFSTNLYPDLQDTHIQQITEVLSERYPNHYVAFRSLNESYYPDMQQALVHHGYTPIPSRQVFLTKEEKEWRAGDRAHVNRDHSYIRKLGYRIVENPAPTAETARQIKALYDDLYLSKYSAYNPAFTEEFHLHALRSNWLHYEVFYAVDEMVGVIGYWQRGGIMTTPIFGYATAHARETKAYLVLSNLVLQASRRHEWRLNQSSGAADFKLKRGCYKEIEFTYIYDRHIGRLRRWPFALLRYVLTKIGIYVFRKYDFK